MKSEVNHTTNPACLQTYGGDLDFAFIVHPRDTQDIFRAYPHLKGLSACEIATYMSNAPVHLLSPITVSFGGRKLYGELLSIPYQACEFRRELRRVQESLFDVLDYCAVRGTRIIGLGALLPSVTHYGRTLADRAPAGVGITTGHTYTAHAIAEYIRKIEILRGTLQRVAIVGAAGSTGRATSDTLLADGFRRQMTFIDLPARLESLGKVISSSSQTCTSSLLALLEADVVVCVTNATHAIIKPEYLSRNAIVIDDAQPPNISLDVVRSRPDVLVIKCLARVPYLQCPFDFGLFSATTHLAKQHNVFTCLAETVLLAASNHVGHFTIGNPSLQQLRYNADLASRFDVGIASFHSFPEIGEVADSRIHLSANLGKLKRELSLKDNKPDSGRDTVREQN